MKLPVKTLEGADAGEIDVPDAVFGITEIRRDLIHATVTYQRAKRRAGTHKVKGRHEIRGTGRKPWKQKGHGPRPRGGPQKAPRRGRRRRARPHAALPRHRAEQARAPPGPGPTPLSAKTARGHLLILDAAIADSHKTKPMAAALAALGLASALIVPGAEVDSNFARATANIPRIDVLPSQGANVYDILRRDTLVLTKQAVADLVERISA